MSGEDAPRRRFSHLDKVHGPRDLVGDDLVKWRSLLSAFQKIDTDSSGQLSAKELGNVLREFHGPTESVAKVSPKLLQDLMEAVDTSKDGMVSFDEFYHAFCAMEGEITVSTVAERWLNFENPGDSGSEFSVQSPPSPSSALPVWQFFLAGGCGGIVSRTATAPLDKLKILAQTSSAPGSSSSTRVCLAALREGVRTHGLRTLFAGNLACCLRVFPFGGLICILYGRILAFLPADSQLDAYEPLWRMAAGAGAGAIATVLTYPLDLVRARLAVHDTANCGSGPGVLGTMRTIVMKEGPSALFRGIRPSLVAVAPFVAIQQASYDTIKQAAFAMGMQPSVALFLGCGSLAGATAQTVVHPIDVIRRRIQIGQSTSAHWSSMLTSLYRQGFSHLFAGLLPAVVKIAPAVALSLLVRDGLLGRLENSK